MKRTVQWLRNQRSSTRLSYLLQISCRILVSLLSLVWTPLLLNSMGPSLNGLFLNFQKMANLGTMGDLGMGGLVNLQTSRLLGQQKRDELRAFLASARSVFLIMTVVGGAAFLCLSPGILRTLKFGSDPGVGSLPLLSVVGGLAIAMIILNSYVTNLNYGCGNILWPIVPAFVILQLSFLGHWLLARQHTPLWQQYLPYLAGTVLLLWVGWIMVRVSQPDLAVIRPLRFSREEFINLGAKSFWVYLYYTAATLYTTTDGFLISAGFGPEWVPQYQYNGKLFEMVMFVVQSASVVSLPKITQWIASPENALRERGLRESLRLNKFQTFLGCCGAFFCLQINDWFVRHWLGRDFQAPLSWQIAFAATLAITAASMMGSDLAARCSVHGIRFGGLTVLGAGLLNVVLSFVAMKRGSIWGIALATSVAISVQALLLCWFSSRQLNISWWRLSLKNGVLALFFVGIGGAAKKWMPVQDGSSLMLMILLSLCVVFLAAWLTGIRLDDLREEKRILQSMFARTKQAPENLQGDK